MRRFVCLDNLLDRQGSWLSSHGPDSDVVVSSRIRLARNISGFPFLGHMVASDVARLVEHISRAIKESLPNDSFYYLSSADLGDDDRAFLMERRLIGDKFPAESEDGAVAIDKNEEFSLSILEEDHLRIQTLGGGFCLRALLAKANRLDDALGAKLNYAFDEKFGFLTPDPSNVGSAMRASAIVHLPGLMETREIVKVFRCLERVNLEVRGYVDSSSAPIGDFFRIGNRVTLGNSEEGIIDSLSEVLTSVVEYEREARSVVLEKDREGFLDRCYRSLGVLKTARVVSYEDAQCRLAHLRLATHMNLFDGLDEERVNALIQGIAPIHLSRRADAQGDDETDEDVLRAEYLRRALNDVA